MAENHFMSEEHLRNRFELLDQLLRGVPLKGLLEHVCRLIEAKDPDYRCCIQFAQGLTELLKGCVAPSLAPEFALALNPSPIAEGGNICARAAALKQPVLAEDLFALESLEPFHPLLRQAQVSSCWAHPVLDPNGDLLGTFSILRNRTGLPEVRDEENLQRGVDLTRLVLERQDRLETISMLEKSYHRTKTSIGFCDARQPDLPLHRANEALCRLLGGHPDTINGRPLRDFFPEEEDFLPLPQVSGKIVTTRGRRLDGSRFQCEINVVPVVDDYGELSRLFLTLHDMSERLQKEQDLAESEARFRRIFEEVPHVAVRGCAPDGSVRYWNKASEALFGYTAAEAMGAKLPRPGDSHYSSSNEYELFRKDGTLVPVFGTNVPIHTPGVGLELYSLEIDLSELKETERERIKLLQLLLQSQKMEALGQLTGGIAHDFNNILATILGNLELVRQENDSVVLAEIQEAAERARDLTQRMLSYSDPRPASRMTTSLQQPIKDVCRILSAGIPSNIQLRLNLSEQAPPAQLDATELHQILANLILNARDGISEQGTIEVGLRYAEVENLVCSSCLRPIQGPLVEIWVRDSGPGVPAEIRSRIFDPFFTTKGVGKGSGLGLAVLHRLVHERGGHVVLAPDGPGAHFRVLLQPSPDSPAPPSVASIQAGGLAKIMVIDDEPMLARMLGRLLTSRGYQPEIFTDSRLAWEAFARDPMAFAAVITDQTMPHKTGDVFAREALALRPDLPILLCTGFSERIDANTARAIGIRYFFQKPVKPATLFEALAEVTTGKAPKPSPK